MMPENACPPPEQLSLYVLGNLEEGRLASIAEHLDVCERCRSHADTFEQRTDPLVEQLRADAKPDPFGDEPALKKVMSHMLEGNGAVHSSACREKLALPPEFGRYRILEEIGAGAMGTVHKAYDTRLERNVALKVPHFRPTENNDLRARFLRESKAAAGIHHPNICQIFEAGEIGGIYFISMPLVEGQSLSTMLESRQSISTQEAVDLVRVIALAMEEAHRQGVVHRDLKPENIIINRRGEPVITDFGLASRQEELVEGARLSFNGMLIGSPAYMSPEQVNGQIDRFGPRCDIYSLGVILFELLTGEQPFKGTVASVLAQIERDPSPRPSSRRADVPQLLDDVCYRAMAKAPDERFSSMAEFASHLDQYLNLQPGTRPLQAARQAELSPVSTTTRNRSDVANGKPRSPLSDFVRSQRWPILFLLVLSVSGMTAWLLMSNKTRPGAGEAILRVHVTRPGLTVEIDYVLYTPAQLKAGVALLPGLRMVVAKKGSMDVDKVGVVLVAGEEREIEIPDDIPPNEP